MPKLCPAGYAWHKICLIQLIGDLFIFKFLVLAALCCVTCAATWAHETTVNISFCTELLNTVGHVPRSNAQAVDHLYSVGLEDDEGTTGYLALPLARVQEFLQHGDIALVDVPLLNFRWIYSHETVARWNQERRLRQGSVGFQKEAQSQAVTDANISNLADYLTKYIRQRLYRVDEKLLPLIPALAAALYFEKSPAERPNVQTFSPDFAQIFEAVASDEVAVPFVEPEIDPQFGQLSFETAIRTHRDYDHDRNKRYQRLVQFLTWLKLPVDKIEKRNSPSRRTLETHFKDLPRRGGFVLALNSAALEKFGAATDIAQQKILLTDLVGIEPVGQNEHDFLEHVRAVVNAPIERD